MTRTLRILWLRWLCWWAQIAIEIDETQIAAHTPSLERNQRRLARLEHELDRLYTPSSLIMEALKRK